MGGTMLGQGPKECEREVSNERGEASLMEILYMHSRYRKRSYFAYSIWSDKKAHDTTLNTPIYETITESSVFYFEC